MLSGTITTTYSCYGLDMPMTIRWCCCNDLNALSMLVCRCPLVCRYPMSMIITMKVIYKQRWVKAKNLQAIFEYNSFHFGNVCHLPGFPKGSSSTDAVMWYFHVTLPLSKYSYSVLVAFYSVIYAFCCEMGFRHRELNGKIGEQSECEDGIKRAHTHTHTHTVPTIAWECNAYFV